MFRSLRQALERNNSIPFAAADAPVFSHTQGQTLLDIIRYARRAILDTLSLRVGSTYQRTVPPVHTGAVLLRKA